ncbi:MAG: AAA-like domain-containing protein [Cyanobacteria bacterium J06635_10]
MGSKSPSQFQPTSALPTSALPSFNNHLHQQLWHLKQNPELAHGFKKVIKETTQSLEQEIAFKLKSLGLIHLEGNIAKISCRLYREYFMV